MQPPLLQTHNTYNLLSQASVGQVPVALAGAGGELLEDVASEADRGVVETHA